MSTVSLSDVGQAVTALNAEMQGLYRESFALSAQQAERVKSFAADMREFGEQQRCIARKLVALEETLQSMLKHL